MRGAVVWAAVCLVLLSAAVASSREGATAILGAFPPELELIRGSLSEKRDSTAFGLAFTLGVLEGRDVVVAESGVGKVNAAMTTTVLLGAFRPREVLFSGIAGALNPDLRPGEIVIGTATAQHDFLYLGADTTMHTSTRNPATGERNPFFIPGDADLLALAAQAAESARLRPIPGTEGDRPPRVIQGVILTGDAFVASNPVKEALRDRLGGDAVEMEGAAVAQVCHEMGVPCLVVRSISDSADSTASRDIEAFYQIAADNSASLVRSLVALLARKANGDD
ncbi:MAG: 5'-methylthioadenosine/adenosylhomocysteine nucleosidase [Candidatus Eisenbacteria bacterium]|nr:5'-methylthioadenosine/adenosylhomocysteine nucleosidase [Candidatus Eisenbacteria bacterium]